MLAAVTPHETGGDLNFDSIRLDWEVGNWEKIVSIFFMLCLLWKQQVKDSQGHQNDDDYDDDCGGGGGQQLAAILGDRLQNVREARSSSTRLVEN